MAPIRSLADLRRELPDEAAARALLERLVWPSGPHCPGCSSLRPWRFHDEGRRSRSGLFQCAEPECGRQFTVTTGTPLHGTKLPLRTWVEALWLVLTSSKGISSVAPARQLGVTQPTAWKLGHAVRALMARAADRLAPLAGTVEVDTKRLGGAPRRLRHVWNPPGKGSRKPIVLVAVQRGGPVRARVVPDESRASLEPPLLAMVDPAATLMSDADAALAAVGRRFARHRTVQHPRRLFAIRIKGRNAPPPIHANTAERFAG
jgi:transposase-like protein